VVQVGEAEGRILYPVGLDLHGVPCLVVGGGDVAARKVGGLVACGAHVTVVAPSTSIRALGESRRTGSSVVVARRPYRPAEAGEYRLVFTATGVEDVDRQVSEDARAAGVWCNSADDARHCSMILPAVHRDGPVSLAVSTGGASPALARWLRTRLAEAAGAHLGELATLLAQARRRMMEAGRPTGSADWEAILDGGLAELVRAGRITEARRFLEAAGSDAPEP
jgi:siroheme synthase-like protein